MGPGDRDALAGSLNVSSATQGLILITTTIDNTLSSGNVTYFGVLQSYIKTFRSTLQTLLPTSILATLSQTRAALLPATDLVAVLSESVLLFSKIDESVTAITQRSDATPSGSEAADLATEITHHCEKWIPKLDEINSILTDYILVLKWFADR